MNTRDYRSRGRHTWGTETQSALHRDRAGWGGVGRGGGGGLDVWLRIQRLLTGPKQLPLPYAIPLPVATDNPILHNRSLIKPIIFHI